MLTLDKFINLQTLINYSYQPAWKKNVYMGGSSSVFLRKTASMIRLGGICKNKNK